MLRGRFEINYEQLYLDAKGIQIEDQLEDELASFADLIRRHYDFKLFLEDPRVSADYKKKCIKDLSPAGLTANFFTIINMLIDHGREELVGQLAQNFTKLLSKDNNILYGAVSSTVPLPEKQKERLGRDIQELEGVPVRLRYSTDPDLLGGLRIKFIDGKVWDISLKHKLSRLKNVILG